MDTDIIATIITGSLAAIKAKFPTPATLADPVVLFEVLQIVGDQYAAATKIVEPPPPPAP